MCLPSLVTVMLDSSGLVTLMLGSSSLATLLLDSPGLVTMMLGPPDLVTLLLDSSTASVTMLPLAGKSDMVFCSAIKLLGNMFSCWLECDICHS